MKKFCNRQTVVGLGFGDEGKGAVTQSLCRQILDESKSVDVVRYCGGPNAGHTVQNNGITHICSSFGSGTLLGVPTTINYTTLVNPMCLKEEYCKLQEIGIIPKFSMSGLCSVITPYDVLANLEDEENRQNGTCGKGMWKTKERLQKLGNNTFCDLSSHQKILYFLNKVSNYYGISRKNQLEDFYIQAVDFICEHVNHYNNTEYSVFESSQGILLDQTFGFQPYITPTNVLQSYIDGQYFFVTRTYTTRHGAGYIPTMIDGFYNLSDKFESNIDNDFQGTFKIGVLDLDIINRGIDRSGIDTKIPVENRNLVITHMDVPIKENKFFYKFNGVVHLIEDVDESKIANEIVKHLYIDFDEIYYLDAPDGNIKLIY